jgi:hypothetical protein
MKGLKLFINISFLVSLCFTLSSCEKLFNKAPEMEDQAFSVEENSPNETIIAQISINDEAGQERHFSIIEGNDDGLFAVSEKEGYLSVNNYLLLDYEAYASRILLVEVEDEFGKTDQAEIKIDLINIEPPTNGLILYMPFDGNLTDYSTNSNNGIDHTTGNFVTGKWGQAKEFNGTSDYIELNRTLSTQYGFSVSFWVNTCGVVGTDNNGCIISKYSMAGDNRCLLLNSFGINDGRTVDRIGVTFYSPNYSVSTDHDNTMSYLEAADLVQYSNPALWTIVNPRKLTKNTWIHCVVNMTSTSLEIWLDNVLCTKKSREYNTYLDSDVKTYIGNCLWGGGGSNNHFHGALDELRVYSRALTQQEICLLYTEL